MRRLAAKAPRESSRVSGRSVPALSKDPRPIGVFDSGLGGLTIVREIRRLLPDENIVYFGDMARLPYGTKSREQILSFSIQNTLFLIRRKVKAVVIACNSSSSAAYSFLKSHFNLPILDVIVPAAESAASATRKGRIGVIATQATIESRAYEKALSRRAPEADIFTASCPLFVPLVEEGWLETPVTLEIAGIYLKPLRARGIDTLILGCTHYPMLRETIGNVMGPGVKLVDSITPTVEKLAFLLRRNGLSYQGSRRAALKVFVSDSPRNFIRVGERFLGERLRHVQVVRQK